ncbi:hypothetical protein H5410_032568, partial [Solanum commersonii]
SVAHEDSFVATEDSFVATEECEQQHDYFISHVKKLTDIFKEITYNIDVHTSKKISQPLKCRRLKKSISQSLSIISERKKSMTTAPVACSNPKGKEKEKEQENEEEEKEKEKEQEKKKENEKVKRKAKEKEKKVEVVSCDVKQQYPFEGFNTDSEGPTELMSSFLQWINEGRDKDDHYLANCSDLEFKQLDFVVAFLKKKDWFYVMSQPNNMRMSFYTICGRSRSNRVILNIDIPQLIIFFKTYIDNASVVPEYENKIVDTIKGFGIPAGLPWHLTDEVYVIVIGSFIGSWKSLY